MNKYQEGKIYKLVCDKSPIIYYGSTCNSLYQRYKQHSLTRNCCSRELFELGNVSIELIENFPCNSKKELEARESIYIDFMLKNFKHKIICNKIVPNKTKEQKTKLYQKKENKKTSIIKKQQKQIEELVYENERLNKLIEIKKEVNVSIDANTTYLDTIHKYCIRSVGDYVSIKDIKKEIENDVCYSSYSRAEKRDSTLPKIVNKIMNDTHLSSKFYKRKKVNGVDIYNVLIDYKLIKPPVD